MEGNSHPKPHAIFVPSPFQGHLNPSVNLAIKLASRGFTITFINTQSIHHQISKAQPIGHDDDIFAAVRQSGLDIRYTTVSDGLPPEFDRSLNLEQLLRALFYTHSAHVEEGVAKIVKTAAPPVNCLIADTFFVWPSKIAKIFGLKYVSFWTEPALVFSLNYHVDLLMKNGHLGCNDPRKDTIDYIPGVRSIDPTDMMSYLQELDISTIQHQIIFKSFEEVRGADFLLRNTVQELEPEIISALQAKMRLYPIGPIFPTGFTKSIVPTSLCPESECTDWLDSKPPGSVLYFSFGSLAHIAKDDLLEIANGLLISGITFIWVLRPDIVSSDDANQLPVGFKEEIGDRGMIIPWCCQIKVLMHPAIGGFFTHCGWNSTLESIWCQIPLLCFPIFTDQLTNRKLIVDDWKIGINLCDKKPITSEEVSDKIINLMKGKSRDKLKKEIKEVRKKLENAIKINGSSEIKLDEFIKDLQVCIQNENGNPL